MLDQLGYQQIDVLGVSWGGALAQQFAFQYPVRCRRLILVSTGTGAFMVPGNPAALAKIATPRRYLDPAYMAQIAGEIYGGKMRTRPELAHEFARTARLGSGLGYFYQMLGGAGWSSIFWLHKLRQPTLILHGDDDPLVPLVNAKIMHGLIPHAKLYIFHDGHLGLGTSAWEITQVVEKFLTAPCAGYVAHPFPKKTVFTRDCRRCDPPFPAFLPRSRSLQDGDGCLDHDGFSVCSPSAIRLLSRSDWPSPDVLLRASEAVLVTSFAPSVPEPASKHDCPPKTRSIVQLSAS